MPDRVAHRTRDILHPPERNFQQQTAEIVLTFPLFVPTLMTEGASMPIIITYDFEGADPNDHTSLRQMLENFGWRAVGGSVFRYSGRHIPQGFDYEDWLNDVVQSLMFFRSYVRSHRMTLKRFTIDASSTSQIDMSDPARSFGNPPKVGKNIRLRGRLTGPREKKLRDFVNACIKATA